MANKDKKRFKRLTKSDLRMGELIEMDKLIQRTRYRQEKVENELI